MAIATLPTTFPFAFSSSSVASTTDVPNKYDVAIGGRGYVLDTTHPLFKEGGLRVPELTRTQADTGAVASEDSLNRDYVWRRSGNTWHLGAGQRYLDRDDSELGRYYKSKGIDVFSEQNQITLHPEALNKKSSANTNLYMTVAGGYLYVCDGNNIAYTTDITAGSPSFTNLTGIPGANPTSITSDGYTIYTSHTASGIYSTTRGSASTASYATGNCTLVSYIKGRLMAAYQDKIYNVTAGGALPAALLDHANSDFTWTCFGEAPAHIIAGGYSGDKSLLYKITIQPDGTALSTPTVCGELPDGEVLRSMVGYLGFLATGSDTGFRLNTIDQNGTITYGAPINLGVAVTAFEPQGRFIYFSWKNYEGTSGIGRIDLRYPDAGGTLTPAYASDLMTTSATSTDTQSIAYFNSRRVFSVSGSGVWAEGTNKVSSGTLDTGLIGFGIAEDKKAVDLDFRHLPLTGSITASVATSASSTFTSVGTSSSASTTGPSSSFNVSGSAELYEIRWTLNRSGSDNTLGPTLTRYTFRTIPRAARSRMVAVPLLLHSTILLRNGYEEDYSSITEIQFIQDLLLNQEIVSYQELSESYSATVAKYNFERDNLEEDNLGYWNGTLVVYMNIISEG